MGIFQRLRAAVARSPTAAQVKMVTETGNGLYVYLWLLDIPTDFETI